jgi:hypothetical protein
MGRINLTPEELRAQQQEAFDADVGRERLPAPEMTPEEILAAQGTRLDDTPPWMTYAAEFKEQLPAELEDGVKAYAEAERHDSNSSEAKEELCRLKEGSEETAKQYRWLHPDDYADRGARIGRIRHSSKFIKMLTDECGLRCWYGRHLQPGRATVLVDRSRGTKKAEVGCWIQLGFMPEYSIMNFDEHGVPLQEAFRGWRTVLLQLILHGYLKQEVVDQVFGKATGPVRHRYLSTLYHARNAGVHV